MGATISGGGANLYFGGWPYTNCVLADYGTIGGGLENSVGEDAAYSFIGGGWGNSIGGLSGQDQWYGSSKFSVLVGGWANQIRSNAFASFLGGGQFNTNGASYSVVPGGDQNFAGGTNSFAAGHRAKANYAGDFVWADSQDADFNSTAINQFSVRASSGAQFVTSGAGLTVDGAPVLTSGGGSGLTIQTNADGAPNIIGGSSVNYIASGVEGSVIAGGGAVNGPVVSGDVDYTNSVSANYSFLGGGGGNSIQPYADKSFLGGGFDNSIQTNAIYSFLGGGVYNSIQTDAACSFLGGGSANSIQSDAGDSFLGGGHVNSIQTNAMLSFLGGGAFNVIQANADYSFLGGGYLNTNSASYSVVPGGDRNFAGGTNSFAAGHRAKANYNGDFVWADSQDADFNSTANNQFLIRAANGVGINKANPASALDVNGTVTATSFVGGGSGLTSLTAANLSGPVPSAALTSVPAASLTGTVDDARLSSNVPLLNASQNSFAGDVRVSGMLRLGSETNTASGPGYPTGSTGLILRRISSTDSTPGKLVARTDFLQLQRDGSPAGLQIAYNAVSYYQTVNAFGITTNGTQVIYRNALRSGSGTLAMFTDAQKVVHYDISFGNPYNNGHTCHVVLDRYDDGTTSDNFLVGTVTTTYNQ